MKVLASGHSLCSVARGLDRPQFVQTVGILFFFVGSSKMWIMKSCFHILLLCFLLKAHTLWAQDYPYEDSSTSSERQSLASELPVEAPTDAASSASASRRPIKRPTSLFRMGLKAGGNFTFFQDRVCQSATSKGCQTYLDRSFTGVGYEGRISFAWDLAYQPISLETDLGYLHKMINLDSPLRVVQLQQGVFHRQRTGKDALWKNGLLLSLDTRIAEGSDEDLGFAIYPAVGVSTLAEWGSFLIQLNIYLSQLRQARNHWSASFVSGLRF
jgi:hypothetical protein